ncbi:MAG: KUP/HAK/KT family potassium transporter [Deltaproteobacteria bacterium]|nr:KUP/HAK/KT family potassium transporter [Deltaproteobacteria bacterium]
MGLVFGDIGTSPIYTLTVVFALTEPNRENVLGILSLVFWTLVLLVTVEFCWLAMSLSHKGEGGKIVMKEILVRIRKQGRVVTFVSLIAYLGVGLLLGDGVITPAISILSAVEGAVLIPGLEDLSEPVLILAAAVIAVGLFAFQKGGTDRVAKAFGPVMVVWFAALSASGIASIGQDVEMLGCVSPHHAFQFFQRNGIPGLFVLSEVILCATGGEALYADMGHLGRKPILNAWNFVFVALVLNYIGQGVYAVHHPEAKNLLFAMVKSQVPVLYIPFLILTISATIIASQAMISGVFSVIYQGITTRVFPLMKVDYTSTQLKSQIYVGSVNWMLLASVLFIMLLFKRSTNLAAAYGFAVTGTMVITGVMMLIIFWCQAERWKVPITALVTVIDVVFLIATMNKLPHGGYWSLILAAVPLAVMFIWTRGQKTLYRLLMPLNWEAFHIGYEEVYGLSPRIPGTAVFFTREANPVPPYVVHCILACNIIYERNVFISVARTDEPFGLESDLTEGLASGLDSLTVRAGYLEVPDIEAILREHGIRPKVMFYGVEDIQTRNLFWRVFSTIKKLAPNFVQFYKLPVNRVQGVVTRVEM